MDGDLPDNVSLALGRLVWSLIYVEDLSRVFVGQIIGDLGQKGINKLIEEALKLIEPYGAKSEIEAAAVWLQTAKEFLPIRNAIMHGVPSHFYPDTDSLKGNRDGARQVIEHRHYSGRYTRIEMNAEYLLKIDDRVSAHCRQWTNVYVEFCTTFDALKGV